MDDFATYLTSEAETSNSIVHEFITSYHQVDEVHVFFEGTEDFFFYLPEIRRVFYDRKIVPYNCAGKWNVVEAKRELEEKYNVNAFFFIDRDFDDLLGRQPVKDQTLYITDVYSIENIVSNHIAAEILCSDLLALTRPVIEALLCEARIIQSKLNPRLIALMAWIIASKDQGKSPNLNNVNNLKDVISVSSEGHLVLSKGGFADFKRRVDSGKGIPDLEKIVHWYRIIRTSPPEVIVRGKYISWIFCKSLCLAIDRWNSENPARKIVTPAHLRSGKNIELLAGRIPYPASLSQFLQQASTRLIRSPWYTTLLR